MIGLTSIIDLIYSFLNISNKLNDMSSYQKNMMISLNKLKMSLDESKLAKYIEAAIQEMRSSKKKRKIDIKSEHLDSHLRKILLNIEEINLIIEQLLLKGNIFKQGINYLFNDTFGSLKQLKCELISRFNCEAFKLAITKRVQLDCLLIKPSSQEKLSTDKKETVMIICNRASCPYELFAYYDKWIECYLSYGINIVLWNYRGFGESTGFSTLSNIQSDIDKLIKFITGKYAFKKFGVHGIALGVIPAAYLVKEKKVSFCFADRSFNSIESFINNKVFPYAFWLLKPFFIQNVDITNYLLSQKDAMVFKVISYDLNKDFIDDNISLKTGIAQSFFKSIDRFGRSNSSSGGKSFLEMLLNDTEKEYEAFEKDIEYIIRKISANNLNDHNEKLELTSDHKEMPSTLLNNDINYHTLMRSNSNNDASQSFNNDISILNATVYSEIRMIQIVRSLFEKFDAGGETLLLLNSNNKREYLNVSDAFLLSD